MSQITHKVIEIQKEKKKSEIERRMDHADRGNNLSFLGGISDSSLQFNSLNWVFWTLHRHMKR